MRILSMTATFGKLDGETLRLRPGLNVITAPNEWGKSTWCAFIMAMLYGVDTRQRTKTGVLAEKDHYKPWSGKPMEGRMDLSWEGKNITIQRRTVGRVPMGDFRIFETDTGLPVSGITAANCGQVLLGVERSVFLRSGFLHGGELSVTQDENLSRRLNQLVTTGDDSPGAMNLENQLRDLKNKIQYNRSGLLPRARADLEEQERRVSDYREIGERMENLRQREAQLKQQREELERHLTNLQAMEDREKLQLVAQAGENRRRAEDRLAQCRAEVSTLPDRMILERQMQELKAVENSLRALDLEAASSAPDPAPMKDYPSLEQAKVDAEVIRNGPHINPAGKAILASGAALMVLCIVVSFVMKEMLWVIGALSGACLAAAGWFFLKKNRISMKEWETQRTRIANRYGTEDRVEMLRRASEHEQEAKERLERLTQWQAEEQERKVRREELMRRGKSLPPRMTLEKGLYLWDTYADANRALVRAKAHLEDMEAVTRGMTVREQEQDDLTTDAQETRRLLERNLSYTEQIRSRLDEARGQASQYGGLLELTDRRDRLEARIRELEKWNAALTMSMDLLAKAQRDLQSRFSPRIAREAKGILASLTGQRYDRLLLEEDLSLSAGASGEGTVVPSHYRSDGTVDQMYLALRLAVCRVMLPGAPLVLDDALNRFDDERFALTMELLDREGETRQVLLFSCQSREREWMRRERRTQHG